MKTMKNVGEIRVLPTNALLHSKKGVAPLIVSIFAIAGVVLGGIWIADKMGWTGSEEVAPLALSPSGQVSIPVATAEQLAVSSCDGIASVKALLNDINYYKKGTDPAGNLTIYEKDGDEFVQIVADDATSTTVPVLSNFKGLAGNSAGTPLSSYFAEEVSFTSLCSDVPIQPKLKPASAPTLTVVNDNGIQANSDSNHESAGASSTYTPCITVKAPAEACAARYGAVVAFEYDATYVSKVDSSDLKLASTSFLVAHTTNHSATGLDMDQYKLMKFDGELCDGDKVEICFDVTTTSSAPGEDQANVQIHWYPINKDIDADEYTLITGIYDEDNNIISQGNTTAIYYTA